MAYEESRNRVLVFKKSECNKQSGLTGKQCYCRRAWREISPKDVVKDVMKGLKFSAGSEPD